MVVFLSGEVHSSWRDKIISECRARQLPVDFRTPVVTHDKSDGIGEQVLGQQPGPFWRDQTAARINAARIRGGIQESDVVVVKFGEKYRQWNAAFDAGFAAALGIPTIVIHPEEFGHALKEVDAYAMATVSTETQVVDILEYLTTQV